MALSDDGNTALVGEPDENPRLVRFPHTPHAADTRRRLGARDLGRGPLPALVAPLELPKMVTFRPIDVRQR